MVPKTPSNIDIADALDRIADLLEVQDANKFRVGAYRYAARQIRTQKKEMATLVGVTPSTISQIESGTIYPSIPALFKIAQVMNVPVTSLFRDRAIADRIVFSGRSPVGFPNIPKQNISGYRLSPPDFVADAEPYLIEIPAGKKIPCHFFLHKGDEFGYVLNGSLDLKIGSLVCHAEAGDVIYLDADHPSQWKNVGSETVRLLWVKITR